MVTFVLTRLVGYLVRVVTKASHFILIMGKRKWQGGKARSTGPSEAFSKQDLGSCKGHGVVLATCDAAKEREASKELCNVITDAVEQLYPEDVGDSSTNDADEDYEQKLSMEEMIKREVEGLKHAPSSSSGNKKNFQKVVSIKTDVKGLVLLKLTSKNHCPLRIVKHIMDLVRSEKRAFTRYAVRLIPLQVVFYPNDVELKEGMNELLSRNIPELAILPLSTDAGGEGDGEGEVDDEHQSKRPKNDNSGIIADQIEKESVTIIQIDKVTTTISTTKPKFTYSVTFKARNNNSFSRDFILQLFNGKLREFGSVDYLNPQVCSLHLMLMCACFLCCLKLDLARCQEVLALAVKKQCMSTRRGIEIITAILPS